MDKASYRDACRQLKTKTFQGQYSASLCTLSLLNRMRYRPKIDLDCKILKKSSKLSLVKNKAVYTTALVADGWAGAENVEK